jgi:hypothetical protein
MDVDNYYKKEDVNDKFLVMYVQDCERLAKEYVDEYPGRGLKIYSRSYLLNKDIDPSDTANWGSEREMVSHGEVKEFVTTSAEEAGVDLSVLFESDYASSQDDHDEFGEALGIKRAERLMRIYQDSYPQGTQYDKTMRTGHYKSTSDVFKIRAKREGYTDKEINWLLRLQ